MKKISLLLFLFFCTKFFISQKIWECINEKGEGIFTIKASRVSSFSNGLAKVKIAQYINDKWEYNYGYVNKKGAVEIPYLYEKAEDFKVNVTWVKKKDSDFYTLIDKKGNIIPTKNYKKVGRFYTGYKGVSEIMCAVYENEKMGFIDISGKEIIPCKYYGSSSFSEGLVCVGLVSDEIERYGFIDTTGKIVLPIKYRQSGVASFQNGECRVSISGKTVIINKKGEIVFKTKYKSLQNFNFGLAAVCTKPDRTGWGFVDKNDNWVIEPNYDYVRAFNYEGYAIVEKNDLKGVLDTTGKMILPMKYETIYMEPSKEGRICAVLPSETPTSLYNAQKEYFDINIKPIKLNNVLYLAGTEGGNLMMYTDLNRKLGYMNRNFEIVIPAQYKKAKAFTEGVAWVRAN